MTRAVSRFVVKDGLVWLALVALTLVGFSSYEASVTGAAFVVLGAGLLKFLLIFLEFMEMKYAHRMWRAAMGSFLVALLGAIALLGLASCSEGGIDSSRTPFELSSRPSTPAGDPAPELVCGASKAEGTTRKGPEEVGRPPGLGLDVRRAPTHEETPQSAYPRRLVWNRCARLWG